MRLCWRRLVRSIPGVGKCMITYWFVDFADVESWGRSTASERGPSPLAISTYGKVLEVSSYGQWMLTVFYEPFR